MKMNKKLRYGGYALLVTLIGIALVVLLNIGLTALDQKFDLKIDTTQNKKYSLTDSTKQTVAGLTKDVRVITLYKEGSENTDVVEIINKFKGLSGHVSIENVDPERNPGFLKQFQKNGEPISAGSIIVTDAENKLVRIIDQYAQFEYGQNSEGKYYVAQIKVEGAIVNAMNYIELGYMPTAFVVQGHGELGMSYLAGVSAFMSDQNYNLETVNIAQTPEKLKAGDIIMFFNPKTDISEAERETLKPLMEKGGRFYFLFDPLTTDAEKMPNLMSLLKLYDIGLKKGVVRETNLGNMARPEYPTYLVPNIQSHTVTSGVVGTGMPVVVPNAGALDLPEAAPESSMKITPLLTTSADAVLKIVDETTTADDLEPKPGDETGTFTVMAAVEKTVGAQAADAVRFIVAYNTEFVANPNIPQVNATLFMDGASWMRNADKEIYVRPKPVTGAVMTINNAFEFWLIVAVAIFLVPVLMLVAGILIYVRRKHL